MAGPQDIVSQWRERVDCDLGAAESLPRCGPWLYAAFLWQQAAEKALEARWCATRTDALPFVHDLERPVCE
jgi:HEPN domain-containing protein